MAGRRETNDLKPIDRVIARMTASHRAVAEANAQVAPKVRSPGGRARNREGQGSMEHRRLANRMPHSGGVVAAARQGRAKQLEKPSSSRRESGGTR
jgi:hypothetical protein